MIQLIWEFAVKQEAEDKFVLTYGPGGAWSKMFSRSRGFRGITLLRDTEKPQRYLAIEIWDAQVHREHMLADRRSEYSELAAKFAEWTESKAELGTFRMIAEATVRPGGGSRQRSPRSDRRRNRRSPRWS